MWKGKEVQHESIRKQCEDRNSSADRAGGTNRKPTLPGRLSRLTQGTKVHRRGLLSGLPKTELHSMCKPQEEKGAERGLVRGRQADRGNRGRPKSAFRLKYR